jgi:sulfite exporter TauE/SafE
MTLLTIFLAFLMGLTGSLHCAGMCGPIIWVLPFQFLTGLKRWAGIFLYHFGRVTTYAFLAMVLHSFRYLFHPQVQQYVSMALGAALLITGALSFFHNRLLKVKLPWVGHIKQLLGRFIGKPGIGALFITGFLNGLLPCGLVYMALSASITAHGPMQAMLFMYSFGLGTMPMLITITVLRKRASFLQTGHLKKVVPVSIFVFGCVFMLRGLNLGIPYLSPAIQVTQHEIKANCCHKSSLGLSFK